MELELTSMEGVAKSGDELAAEDAAEHADGQEEGAPGGDPAGVIRSEAAGGNVRSGHADETAGADSSCGAR